MHLEILADTLSEENQQLQKINNDFLYTLKLDYNTNLLKTSFEPVIKPLENSFYKFIEMFDQSETTSKEIVDYILNDSLLNILFENYKYCQDLDGTDQGLCKITDIINTNLPENITFLSTYKTLIGKNKKEILDECKERFLGHCLNETYKKCFKNQEEILAFSHRIHGWNKYNHQLNNNFHIELNILPA